MQLTRNMAKMFNKMMEVMAWSDAGDIATTNAALRQIGPPTGGLYLNCDE